MIRSLTISPFSDPWLGRTVHHGPGGEFRVTRTLRHWEAVYYACIWRGQAKMGCLPSLTFLFCVLVVCSQYCASFGLGRRRPQASADIRADASCSSRRNFCAAIIATSLAGGGEAANAGSFAPGGTLLDREVSVTYGNEEASPSRQPNNSNVIFNLDQYYKFGSAARWIA